jgi:multicomponent Na+:H+ antiporter subunit A
MLFFGEKPTGLHKVHSPPKAMLGPPLVLGVLAALVSVGGVLGTFGVHFAPFDHFVTEVWASTVAPDADLHGGFSYYFPDHVTPAVAMSAVTLVAGAAAYPFYGRLHRGVNRLTDADLLRANWYYDSAVFGTNDFSDTAAETVQNGLLRTYATWAMASVAVLALAGYAAAGVALPDFSGFAVGIPVVLVLGVAIVGAVAVSIAPSHISGVLTLSILGFMVAVFYVLASAPDLALTQLVVETLLLVIFLMVLDKLPAFYGNAGRGKLIRDGALSAVVGATVFVTVLVSTAAAPADGIADYFRDPAVTVDQAGGHNIVNVILVDFRAFDTMGEIAVVAMAALSVLTLVAMRERGETQ